MISCERWRRVRSAAPRGPCTWMYGPPTPLRVGLIGSGWYGKCDLFRLIQVAPVEVVSLCDVDKQLLADAATQVAARQASKKTPRTYGDYRKMLAERDLDLVIIATPDHWHALTAIEAMKAGADLYLQKPISVDVAEGQAILAAARQVQARRAGGHAAAQHAPPRARARSDRPRGQARHDRPRRDLLLLPHANAGEPARHAAAAASRLRDVDRPRAAAAIQPPRAPARVARLHGIRQRHRRRHVHPHARRGPVDARSGHADAHRLDRRHPRGQGEQGEHQRHAGRHVRLPEPARRLDPPDVRRPAGSRSIRGG